MAIDPMLYRKLSGRSGDPYTRMGEALAKNAKAKSERDEMPKGVTGGLNTTRMPGIWAQIFLWFKDRGRSK
ncbi:MAG: hypothetical protein KF699_07240 [Phycisphaeraceae bacterium]|nr:hypothetical protein [Phycisphaeraceae bacterium]MBX3405149.1 hypothetical protein [Phycisphaeraceae bacterium]